MTTLRSRVKKGVAARVWARIKLEWEDSDRRAVNVVFGILAIFFRYVAYSPRLIVLFALWFCLWQIASWIKKLMSAERKLRIARDGMLYVALQKCCCGGEGRCHICRVRDALEEQFPGEIEHRLRVELLGGWPVPEELAASYLTPDELARAQTGAGAEILGGARTDA